MINLDEVVAYATSEQTKLNDKAFNLEGMSSRNVRNLLNKCIESIDNVNYLEIGVWKGSTLYSALYGNNPSYALAIDKFCSFGGRSVKQYFENNLADVGVPFDFIDQDCFEVDLSKINHKFNVYFYDGEHYEKDQEMALTYYYDVLDDTFLYICDDYNEPHVQKGTDQGIEKTGLKILDQRKLFSKHNGDTSSWWNGILLAVLQK